MKFLCSNWNFRQFTSAHVQGADRKETMAAHYVSLSPYYIPNVMQMAHSKLNEYGPINAVTLPQSVGGSILIYLPKCFI